MSVRKTRPRSLLAFAALSVLSAVAVCGAGALLGVELCGNEILADVPSPSGQRHAVVFVRDCGATTRRSAQLSVLRRWERPRNRSGNALTTDATELTATWDSDAVLRIRYAPATQTFRREDRVAGVRIVYPDGDPR